MEINMNLDATKGKGFELLPEADYTLTCTGVKDGKQSPGKNPYVTLELTVSEGEFQGRKIWHNFVFLPTDHEHHGMTVNGLKAFGLPFDGDVSFDSEEFRGRGCRARVGVKEEEYQGEKKKKQRVKWFITDEEEIAPREAAATGSKGEKEPW